MDSLGYIIPMVVCVILSAYFSATETAFSTISVMTIVAGATLFAFVLTKEKIPNQLAELMLEYTHGNVVLFLMFTNILFLILGCFLEPTAAMLIMNRIGGGASFAEIHPFDTESDVVLVGHDGPHNIEISSRKPYLRKLKKYHGKNGSGVGVEFSIKTGELTLLSITVDRDGEFHMIAAVGESLPGEIPQTGNTNTKVHFGRPINEFLEKWCEAGPTHHLALGCGNKLETIKKFAWLSGIRLTVV